MGVDKDTLIKSSKLRGCEECAGKVSRWRAHVHGTAIPVAR